MAINISEDINVTTGGKLTDIGAIQGGWRTVDNLSDMHALTASAAGQGLIQNGQVFYVSSSRELYTIDITGAFPFTTYNFNEFEYPRTSSSGGGASDTASYVAGANVDGAVTLANTASYVLGSNVDGSVTLADTASFVTASNVYGVIDSASVAVTAGEAEKVTFEVQNSGSVTLAKGTPVHINQTTNGTALVIAASSSVANTMPAHGILMSSLNAGQNGTAAVIGNITGINTSTFSSGDTLYVAASGGYTNVKPTGTNLIQNLGIVKRVDTTNGTAQIFGSGRSNDLPNIAEGYAWVGNASGVPVAVLTSSFSGGAGDITDVIAGDGLTGGATSSAATLSIDTSSAHFITGVIDQSVFKQTGSIYATTNDLQITGSLGFNKDNSGNAIEVYSGVLPRFEVSSSGLLTLATQSFTPTAVEGGLYLDTNYDLYVGVQS